MGLRGINRMFEKTVLGTFVKHNNNIRYLLNARNKVINLIYILT